MNQNLKMGENKLVIISIVLTTFISVNHGCNINDHQLWTIPIQTTILDTYEGTVFSRGTTDIESINSTSYGQATLAGPYFDLSIVDSQLIVQTNSAFRSYEEVEVASRVAITVEFNCVGGSTRGGLILWIDITDTNNNAPQFMPTDEYEFVITPPLPPGYSITGCYNDIITARDIDLTTQRIDFSLDDNTYFEIFYDEASSTTVKQFNAQIRTTTFIRSLNETLTLTITATDVDLTSDPALSTTAILRIKADSEFQFPEEPVFSQTFYLANYTDDHQLILLETISLRQGFDEYVNFTLEGEYLEYFEFNQNGNEVSLIVSNPIPVDVWSEGQIFFIIKAEREYTSGGSATVIVQLYEGIELQFERVFYEGYIEDNNLQLSPLTLSQGYDGTTVTAEVIGDLSSYFTASVQQNLVTLTMDPSMSEVIEGNSFISLQVLASSDHSSAYTVVNLDIIKDDNVTPVFDQSIYLGVYDPATGLSVEQIQFVQGFDDTVTVDLFGEHANLFQIVRNGYVLTLTSSEIPPEIFSQQNILISIEASKPRTVGANAAIHIVLPAARKLEFEEPIYRGSIEDEVITLRTILLTQGYEDGVSFNIIGEYSTYFTTTNVLDEVTILLTRTLPESVITENSMIVLTLIAYGMNAVSARTEILLDLVKNDTTTPVFSQLIYFGSYSEAAIEIETINLAQGFDDIVSFRLDGAQAQYFEVSNIQNNVIISLQSPIPENVIFSEKALLFNVLADKALTVGANAAVLITFPTELTDLAILKFSRNSYIGSLENNEIQIENIVLESGFANGVGFSLFGDYAEHFSVTSTGNVVQISSLNTLPDSVLENNHFIILEIEATRARAVTTWTSVVLDIVKEEIIAPVFGQAYYTGVYTETSGLIFEETINISEGYDDTLTFALNGESSTWFDIQKDGNSVSLVLKHPVPSEIVENNSYIVFTIVANKPNIDSGFAVIFIVFREDPQPGSDVTFDKVLYEGVIQDSVVNHETITVVGFSGSVIELRGDYSSQFESDLSSGEVIVSLSGPLTLPENVTHVALELHAGTASCVLLLNIPNTAGPSTPTVTFSSSSYGFQVDTSHAGLVGQVHATASNEEAVTYSLLLDSTLLQASMTVNAGGELYLASPLNNGLYSIEVVATTVSTQIQGFATVHLSVEAVNLCPDEIAMNPLIIIDVDEEEPHHDLLNGTQYENCHFTLTNRWPLDQTWVYVDENGLHTTAIDREHESIAFMPLSQVQVEINLYCEGDPTRIKRSLNSDALGPYDYGSNKWILTDTIFFNSRRSFVNIIVNDINDNAPIFMGKGNEPIAVGYPVPELAERILPRSLVELKATDADIGENAALLYWSSAPELAVAPTTGFVHLRDLSTLENGSRYTVKATDRNGQGLNGSIDILVRLLDENHIAVVTIRDAFLDDEENIISSLSEGVGYEVKVLRSAVISDGGTDVSRIKRDVSRIDGASLQLYVYGLIAREPVSVDKLTADISNIVTAPVIIASSVSLQDHLEGQEICVIVGRDTGLLVATIVLSVLLFIVLILIAVWFFLRWRKNRNYDEFSDMNSLASRNVSDDNVPKPEAASKPRLDYAELKKSERRLQEMLDAPVEEVVVEPTIDSINDAILDMPEPIKPIVIQSIDKLKDASDESEDEYGEMDLPRRKSVVTFNENVEKIIHLEDTRTSDAEDDISDEPELEIYKL